MIAIVSLSIVLLDEPLETDLKLHTYIAKYASNETVNAVERQLRRLDDGNGFSQAH